MTLSASGGAKPRRRERKGCVATKPSSGLGTINRVLLSTRQRASLERAKAGTSRSERTMQQNDAFIERSVTQPAGKADHLEERKVATQPRCRRRR